MVLGIVPYISIQIKAITDSFIVLWQGIEQTNKAVGSLGWADGASLYFTVLLALVCGLAHARHKQPHKTKAW